MPVFARFSSSWIRIRIRNEVKGRIRFRIKSDPHKTERADTDPHHRILNTQNATSAHSHICVKYRYVETGYLFLQFFLPNTILWPLGRGPIKLLGPQ
jgi:hypothetical protein